MIADFPASEQPTSLVVAREVAASAAFLLLHPFGWRPERKRTPRRASQRTVVLVHGYGGNHGAFLPLAAYLRARGVQQLLRFDYRASDGIERTARELRDFLKWSVRGGRIDLVCHSLGGLVGRVYLEQLGGARRVDRCITLGTPHRGTYNAYWLAASQANASGVRFTSIVAGSDNIVIPRVFAAGDDLVYVPHLGHLGMLFSPSVFRAVADRLLS